MSKTPELIAMMAAMPLPAQVAGSPVPTEIHILPRGGDVRTTDGRGPYRFVDAAAVIAASFAERDRIEIDINHSTYLAAPKGGAAPAVGWITSMHAREDGLWATVDWTEAGRALLSDRAYRGISPVLGHHANGDIRRVLNATLTNRPNLKGLTTLHMQQEETPSMDWLVEMLGLEAGATEEQLRAAVARLMEGRADAPAAETVAMQSQMTAIGSALGVAGDATGEAILAAARAKAGGVAQPAEIVALQSEISSLTAQVGTLTEGRSREKATTFVDAEIARGRAGLRPVRDRYITMHMADVAGTEELIGALPILGPSGTSVLPPAQADGKITLNSEQVSVAKMMGFSSTEFAEKLKADAARKETL